MDIIMKTYCVNVTQLKEGDEDKFLGRCSGAEFMVTWGEDHQHSAPGEVNITESFSDEDVKSQFLRGVAMPTRNERAIPTAEEQIGNIEEKEEKEEDLQDEQETLEEIEQAREDHVATQACEVITDQQFQDAVADDKMYLKIKKKLENPKQKERTKKQWRIEDNIMWLKKANGREVKYVPASLRREVIRTSHDSDFNQHAGRESTLQDLKERFYWPNMDADVTRYIKHCIWCRKAKSWLPVKAGKLQQTLHQHCGTLLSIDLVGPLRRTATHKFQYILTVLDAFSHHLTAVPIKSKSAVDVLEAFVQHVVLQGLLPSRLVSVKGELVKRKGSIISDNGTEFKNELMQNFLKLFEIRFGYAIPYHPQSNPVERVHRYVGSLLKIALNKSNRIFDNWDEALPYIIFSYNKKHIPGTLISPFMLRNGYQPMYPTELATKELIFQNDTYESKLNSMVELYQTMEDIVRAAHEQSKADQKLKYDKDHYDVEFKIGSLVLWHCDDQIDKLCFKWHGPYKVVEKKSPVKYIIEDMLDDKRQVVSVQQIVPFFGECAELDGGSGDITAEQGVQLDMFKNMIKGKFVVFQRHDIVIKHGYRAIHIGEVTKPYNANTGEVEIFHYIDLGKQDKLSAYDVTKKISDRKVYPEYVDENGDSYTRNRASSKLRPNSSEYKESYTLDRIVIISDNWTLEKGGKVPTNICLKVEDYLKNYNNT